MKIFSFPLVIWAQAAMLIGSTGYLTWGIYAESFTKTDFLAGALTLGFAGLLGLFCAYVLGSKNSLIIITRSTREKTKSFDIDHIP